MNHSEEVPPLYLVIKGHKVVQPGQLPKTRPIVAACQSMTRHMAGLLSDLIEALADNMSNPLEVVSSEDLLAVIEEYNQQVQAGYFGDDFDPDEVLLLGADVRALSPSLDCKEVSKEVMKKLLETEMRIE